MLSDLNDAKLPDLKQQAIDWLVRLRDENISDAEINAFADWLAEDYRHSEAFAAAEDLFNDMVLAASSVPASTQHAINTPETITKVVSLSRVSAKPAKSQSSKLAIRAGHWLPAMLAVAAVWLFSVILVMPENSYPLERLLSDYYTVTGELRSIQLADGSHLLLNTNSAVSINYDAAKRQVILHHGQVRFTVAKDSLRPFEVKVDDMNITALGTVFDVLRTDAKATSVTVQQHAVSVNLLNGEHVQKTLAGVFVQEGQQLRYRHDGILSAAQPIELEQVTAWQQHRLLINDRPLGELISELNRYRVGRIFLSDKQLSKLRVTGVFSLDKPDDILRSVCNVLNLQETHLSDWWILLHR
jgi:transmembrane sensor